MEKSTSLPEIVVTFRHTDPSDPLRQHALDKITHCLRKYGVADGDVHIILSVEKRDHTAEVTMHSRHFEVAVKATTEDLYTAVDRLVENVDKQIRKQKEKLVSHKHTSEKRIEP